MPHEKTKGHQVAEAGRNSKAARKEMKHHHRKSAKGVVQFARGGEIYKKDNKISDTSAFKNNNWSATEKVKTDQYKCTRRSGCQCPRRTSKNKQPSFIKGDHPDKGKSLYSRGSITFRSSTMVGKTSKVSLQYDEVMNKQIQDIVRTRYVANQFSPLRKYISIQVENLR